MRSVIKCKVYSAGCKVKSVECKVHSVKCRVRSAKCKVRSVKRRGYTGLKPADLFDYLFNLFW